MTRVLAIITLFVLFFLSATLFYLKTNSKPVSVDKNNVLFVINEGESLVNISQKLKSNFLIRDKYSFLFYTYKLGLNTKIQAGTFRLSPSLSTKELIVKLSKGGVSDYWLKIIDGYRVEEVARVFPQNLSFSSVDFINQTKSLEGYLFPDSYLIPEYFNIDQVLSVIKTNFDSKFNQAKQGVITQKLTDSEIIILASIIEREARTLKSKQEIAGVLYNRLKKGMPLQVDASVQYARDTQTRPQNYWQPLKSTEIASTNSPYNTYQYKGLPPFPICNPGFNSLYAAFHPISSDYLYYITGNDHKMHYAISYEEHKSNIAKYLK